MSRARKRGWVGTRRVAYRYVSSSPPLSTGRAACTASGSAPVVDLHGATREHLFPLRRHPQDFTRVSCQFAGIHESKNARGQRARSLGPLFVASSLSSILPKARGLRRGDDSPCGPRYCPLTPLPHPTLREGLGVALGSPFPPSHSPSHPSRSLPCAVWRTPTACWRWRVPAGPLRSLRLPSHHTG